MRKFAFALLVSAVAMAPLAAQAASLIDFVGFSWETNGFPDSNVNDQLELVARVDGLTSPLSWDPATHEYTLHLADLFSQGSQQPDGQNIVVEYQGGTVGLYEDSHISGTASDPGSLPPNASAPGFYTDGAQYLTGAVNQFTIFYNTQFQSGAFEANVLFEGGDHHGELGAQTQGFTFGGVFVFGTPEGYDLQWDGQILLEPVPVEDVTWGEIKNTFRP